MPAVADHDQFDVRPPLQNCRKRFDEEVGPFIRMFQRANRHNPLQCCSGRFLRRAGKRGVVELNARIVGRKRLAKRPFTELNVRHADGEPAARVPLLQRRFCHIRGGRGESTLLTLLVRHPRSYYRPQHMIDGSRCEHVVRIGDNFDAVRAVRASQVRSERARDQRRDAQNYGARRHQGGLDRSSDHGQRGQRGQRPDIVRQRNDFNAGTDDWLRRRGCRVYIAHTSDDANVVEHFKISAPERVWKRSVRPHCSVRCSHEPLFNVDKDAAVVGSHDSCLSADDKACGESVKRLRRTVRLA